MIPADDPLPMILADDPCHGERAAFREQGRRIDCDEDVSAIAAVGLSSRMPMELKWDGTDRYAHTPRSG